MGAKTLQSFSSVFIFVGTAAGTGLGYYFMKSDIEKMIDEFYNYFIEHAEDFSDSFDQAIQYLIERANKYDDWLDKKYLKNFHELNNNINKNS